MRVLLATLAVALVTSCASSTCPDGSPVYLEKHCDRLFPTAARDSAGAAQAQFEKPNLLTAGVGVIFATRVHSLADKISDSTVKLQSSLTAFCQYSNRNACNADITSKLIVYTTAITSLYGELSAKSTEAANALTATQGGDQKQQQQIADAKLTEVEKVTQQIEKLVASMLGETKTQP